MDRTIHNFSYVNVAGDRGTAAAATAASQQLSHLARPLDHHAQGPNIPFGVIPHFDKYATDWDGSDEKIKTDVIGDRWKLDLGNLEMCDLWVSMLNIQYACSVVSPSLSLSLHVFV